MQQNQFTDDNIWQYCLENTNELSENLQNLTEVTKANVHGAQMLSEKMNIKLIQFLIFSCQAKICVDVGTYTGMSAIAMAEVAPEATIFTIDKPSQAGREIAQKFTSKYPNIKYLEGDAINILPDLSNEIDFIFIDADKKQTQDYFDILLPKLSDRGIIMVDDILWRGEVLQPQDKRAKALDDFNKYINSRSDVENIVLPIRHGLNIIRKKDI